MNMEYEDEDPFGGYDSDKDKEYIPSESSNR